MTTTSFTSRCLPGDVEVLAEAGWRRGVELRDHERVAQWDPTSGDVTLEPVTRVETGVYEGDVIDVVGTVGSTTGNPTRGVWVRTPVGDDDAVWTAWHPRPLEQLVGLAGLRVPVSGHRNGPGLHNDYGDHAGVLGWISVEEGYYGTSVQIHYTEANHHRAVATSTRLASLGASVRRTTRSGGGVDAWFLPGPLTATIRRELTGGIVSWSTVWKMNSVELNSFMDGAAGVQRRTLDHLDVTTIDLMQGIAAITGHRTHAHDVGRRLGGSLDITIGLEVPITRERLKRRSEPWHGPAFALTTRTGAVIARRNFRVFVAAT